MPSRRGGGGAAVPARPAGLAGGPGAWSANGGPGSDGGAAAAHRPAVGLRHLVGGLLRLCMAGPCLGRTAAAAGAARAGRDPAGSGGSVSRHLPLAVATLARRSLAPGRGRVFYRTLPKQRLLQKAWTQELLGRWRPAPLSAEVLVIRSGWRQRPSRRRIGALHPGARVLDLPCRRHEQVLTDPQAMALWQEWMRESLRSPPG